MSYYLLVPGAHCHIAVEFVVGRCSLCTHSSITHITITAKHFEYKNQVVRILFELFLNLFM